MAERFIIIGRSTCPYCNMAQDFAIAKQKKVIFLDYCNASDILEDYKIFHNHKTVPIVLSNDLDSGLTKKIGGYTDLLDYLNNEG